MRGETARRFSLGIGVDLPQPAAAAIEFVTPETSSFDAGPPPANISGWFFHLGAKNVVATHWQPLVDAGGTIWQLAGGTWVTLVRGREPLPGAAPFYPL